jgi:hypothetical protein
MGIMGIMGCQGAYRGSSMGRYAVLPWVFCEVVTREVNRNRRLEFDAFGDSLRHRFETFIRSRTE